VDIAAEGGLADAAAGAEAHVVGAQLQGRAEHLFLVVGEEEFDLAAGGEGGIEGAGEDDIAALVDIPVGG
jgi:hypothetical protein